MAETKFDPEVFTAEYLAKQHGIDRQSYLKEGLSDKDFIEQYGKKPIGAPEGFQANAGEASPVSSEGYQATTSEDTAKLGDISPWVGGAIGAQLGATYGAPAVGAYHIGTAAIDRLGRAMNKGNGSEAGMPKRSPSDMLNVPRDLPTTEFASPELNIPAEEYHNPHGYGEPAVKSANINQDIADIHTGARNMGTMGAEAPRVADVERQFNNRVWTPKGADISNTGVADRARQEALDKARRAAAMKIEQEAASQAAQAEAQRAYLARQGASNALAEAKAKAAAKARPLTSKIADTARRVAPSGVGSKILGTAMPIASGASAGYEGVDAWNRFKHGDSPGAVISGLGAIGSGLALVPRTRGLGEAMMVGAPALKAAWDKWGNAEHKAGGGRIGALTGLAKPLVKKLSEALGDVGAEGKNLSSTQSDRTIVGLGQKGGPGFPGLQHTDPEHAAANAVWGVGKTGPATMMVNANKKDPQGGRIWTSYVGGANQHTSNPMVLGEMMDAFIKVAKEGKLSPELYKKINSRLSSDVTGNLFDTSVDILDPAFLKSADTFEKRRLVGDVMGGEGVGKTKGQIIPYQDILNKYTDPAFIGQPTGVLGNRLFTLDNTVTHNPDIHGGFPYILGGEDLKTQFHPVPADIGMRDFVANKAKQKNAKGVSPTMGTYDWIHGTPTQPVTEDYLSFLQKEGYAEGGLASVKKKSPDAKNFQLSTGAIESLLSGNGDPSNFLAQAKHDLTHFPKSTTPNKPPSLDDPAVQAAMAFAPMGLGVVKNPGGTWLPDAVNELTWDAKARLAHTPAAKSVKNWYDTVLNKYVQNRMGSPSDEIRKLADQGISHIPASRLEAAHANIGPDRIVKSARKTSGFPEEGLATSPLGKLWEDVSDSQIESKPRKFINSGTTSEMPGIEKLSPEDLVHYNSGLNPENLGFKHIGDMLQSDINAGKLTPEQLAQMSVEKAIRRTQNFNKTQAQAQETAQQSLPTVKDYPTGFTWKELTHSDPDTLDAILKKEGDTMQNCIGGYGADVIEDGTKLYSLRDPAGNPHANVEVRPHSTLSREAFRDQMDPSIYSKEQISKLSDPELISAYEQLLPNSSQLSHVKQHGFAGPRINQVKGKQNEAPNESYQHYVQDFIQNPHEGTPFSVVGDLENTGLSDVTNLKKYGIIPSGPLRDKVLGEVGRIHPTEISPTGGRVSSGQHGVRLNTDELLPNLLKDLPGNYVNDEQLLSHLQGKSPRPVEESYSNFYDQPTGMVGGLAHFAGGGAIQAYSDALTMPFLQHSLWYENNLPPMLDKYNNKIGPKRIEGGARDSAAEFAGAADYGQRAPADYNRALENATYYQNSRNSGKNAADNITQDAAGLALGMCNPLMPKKDLVKQAVKYGLSNDFSE